MKTLLAILIFFVFTGFKKSAPPVEDYRFKLKAAFIYNFATLIDWPANRKSGEFVIAVYGDDAVFKELKGRYSAKSVGSQKIKLIKYSSVSEVGKSHILFVGESKKKEVSSCKSKSYSYNTLLVTEVVGGLSKGAIINFMGPSGVNYEISKSNAKKNKLVVASRLLNLAKKVE